MSVFIPGIIVFGIVVLVHEIGHFLMARACRVPIERFSVGFGPRVWGIRRGGIEYVISALPLGGYVKMAGEDLPESGQPADPNSFLGHPWWHRVLIAVAGPGANFVFAVLVTILMFLSGIHYPDSLNRVGRIAADSAPAKIGLLPEDLIVEVDGKPTRTGREVRLGLMGGEEAPLLETPRDVPLVVTRGATRVPLTAPGAELRAILENLVFFQPPVVGDVINGMPAYVAGLKAGDRITAVDGSPVEEWTDLTALISKRAGQPIQLDVEREGRHLTLRVTPMKQQEEGRALGRIGIWPEQREYVMRYSPGQAVIQGTLETVGRVWLTTTGIISLFRHPGSLGQSVSGPIAIMEMSGQAAQRGFFYLANITAIISIALMVFNLLPVPILDGGLVVMAVAEAIRRRPVPTRVQVMFQRVGLALLGSLIIFALLNDPLKMIRRSRAISETRERTTTTTPEPGRVTPDAQRP